MRFLQRSRTGLCCLHLDAEAASGGGGGVGKRVFLQVLFFSVEYREAVTLFQQGKRDEVSLGESYRQFMGRGRGRPLWQPFCKLGFEMQSAAAFFFKKNCMSGVHIFFFTANNSLFPPLSVGVKLQSYRIK